MTPIPVQPCVHCGASIMIVHIFDGTTIEVDSMPHQSTDVDATVIARAGIDGKLHGWIETPSRPHEEPFLRFKPHHVRCMTLPGL